MTENKTNHEVCTECHHPEKPENDCCCTHPQKPHQNDCIKCCDPLEFKCPDIRKATCVPILGERIYDFKCIIKKQERAISNIVFYVDDPNVPYKDGDKVCIEKILIKYDCIGFINDELPIILDSSGIDLPNTYPLSCSTQDNPLYSSYCGDISPHFICCDEGRKVNLAQGSVGVGVTNYQYVLYGKIGCIPFIARHDISPYTGPLNTYGCVTLYNDVCLPQVESCVHVKADFQLEIVPKCVIPKSTYCNGQFTANIFDCLSIKEKFYITVKDELIVYTAFHGLDCDSDCHHYSHDFYEEWCKN